MLSWATFRGWWVRIGRMQLRQRTVMLIAHRTIDAIPVPWKGRLVMQGIAHLPENVSHMRLRDLILLDNRTAVAQEQAIRDRLRFQINGCRVIKICNVLPLLLDDQA